MAFSTEQRADQVAQANAEKNRNKEEAKEILSTEAGVLQMASLAEGGGSMGRRIARELQQFEATGRVSNWLAGETIKAESKREVPSSVVDDFVRRGVMPATFQVQPALPFGGLPQYVPTIPLQGGGTPPPPPCALGLYNKDGNVYINSGTIAGQLPPSFDPVEGKFIAGSGSGSVYAEIEINGNTGEINSVDVKRGTGSNTDTKFVIAIGAYEYDQNDQPQITNFRCGSISISLCRNWFVAEPPYFTANIS